MMIITESWLNSNIPDDAVEISKKFNAHRRDRSTPGGGVLVYVGRQIPTTRLKMWKKMIKKFCGFHSNRPEFPGLTA